MKTIVTKIINFSNDGNGIDACIEIDDAFVNLLGIDPLLIDNLSSQEIAELLNESKDNLPGVVKSLIAAQLIQQKANILINRDKENAIEFYHKSFVLYLYVFLDSSECGLDLGNYSSDIKSLEECLKTKITSEETYLLFQFYNKIQGYDRASEYLFQMLNSCHQDINKIGIEFFENLKNVDEKQLQQCNLSKKTIDSAYKTFFMSSKI
jgi:tetratricopeptide (TPR) repeat protein